MFWQITVLILLLPSKSASLANKYNALHFGTTNGDYISYTRDMSPFRNALTICTWIKRVDTSGSHPVVLNYWTSKHEIVIGSDGEYNRVVDDTVLENSHSYFQTPVGQWFSYCISWSRSTNTIQLYLDGQLVRSGKTSSRNWRDLHSSGTLWFNRLGNSENSEFVFGGQLYQFSMFPEVLSAESIRKIAQGGLCFDMSEISSVPVLKWEEVMAKPRSGNVTEVLGCDFHAELQRVQEKLRNVTSELNRTKTNLDSVSTQLTQTQEELKTATKTLNKTEVNLETCNSTLLEKTDQLELTVGKLENCSLSLRETVKDLQDARKLEDVTKWDILYTSPYFNHYLTSELIDKLKSSWDVLGKHLSKK